jgi:hypothetical protein
LAITKIFLGAVSLLFGRKLYWLFVAIAGFLFVFEATESALSGHAALIQYTIAIIAGGIGALFAIVLQRVGFAVAGFFAGGYFVALLLRHAGIPGDPLVWVVIGGVAGAVIAAFTMDWALIVLSSIVGAAAIADALQLEAALQTVVFGVLVVVGIVVQSATARRAEIKRKKSS